MLIMSEFYKLARGKLEEVDYSNDLPIVPSSQVTDLAWENDRFISGMTSTSLNDDQSNASRFYVNDLGNPADLKNKNLEAVNYFQPLVPSTEIEPSLNNDTSPVPRYPVDDFRHYSDLLPEMTLNELALTNNFPSINKINSLDLTTSGANSISSDIGASSGLRSGQFRSLLIKGTTDIARAQTFVEGVFPSTRVHKQDPGIANPTSFSSLFQANFANGDSVPNFGTLVNNPSDIRKDLCAIEEKGIIVPTITSSSVCSGVEELCGNPAQKLKRKYPKSDDHEETSEDLEDESTGAVKASIAKGHTSSKRGRTTEVHNLSERRRRDRINERMRVLQELIPNCNKVDKATLLEEAIEYMKTLQRQVQMMSMGAGLYVPPMMLPPHMQQIQAAYMPCFSHTGQGMGCGLAMNTMAQVPVMQVTHFPGPSLQPDSKPTSFRPMAGTNFSSFRRPSQRDPFLASCINPNSIALEVPCCTGPSNPNDLVKYNNLRLMDYTEGCGADKQKTIQLQSEEELFKASNLVPTNNSPSYARSGDNVNLAKENNMVEDTSIK